MAEDYGVWTDWLLCLAIAALLELRLPNMGRPITEQYTAAPSGAWHEKNLFWGSAGLCIGFILPAVGFGVNGNNTLAHVLFLLAWPCGTLACWCILNHYFRKKRVVSIFSGLALIAISALLFLADSASTKANRPHIHIIGVDLLRAFPGVVIESRVRFQDDGNEPITQLRNVIVMAVCPFSSDTKFQSETEEQLFAQLKGKIDVEMLPENNVPAHSIELNSDNKGTTPLTLPMLDEIRTGRSAIYLVGTIYYKTTGNFVRNCAIPITATSQKAM